MMKLPTTTRINTKRWQEWNVGKGCRFENMEALLKELEGIMNKMGTYCGFAGGNILDEIAIVKDLIKEKNEKEDNN